MDDLNSVISSILGDPQKMEQLRSVAQSLGMNPGGPPPSPGSGQGNPNPMNQEPVTNPMNGFPNQNMGQMGQNMGQPMNNGPTSTNNMDNSAGNNQGFNLGSISKLAGMLGNFNNASDKNVQLLRALQPHISTGRAGRIDDAVRIMQLMSAWPAIRDSGLLGSLGNLFTGGGHK